ncbi:hypothetical protein Nepgr_020545 [Nepenthes gracilis]|uniref:ABC transporter family G domain-containing protein n=1 Tax=Nepenthes gracilis TaxID=150966 RepID=A0AAD3XW59_NEPGR|nr:hypothetical protein Nepgr_020545 [Nepenthes gracilis]
MNQGLFRGFTITTALREGHLEILEILLKARASQPTCEEALLEASCDGREGFVELLVGSDLILSHVLVHAFVTACCKGFNDVVDVFLRQTDIASTEGLEENVVTDYILKGLSLELCAEYNGRDEKVQGISRGPRKQVTISEMLVGLAKVLIMDEILLGSDSSTIFPIVPLFGQYIHILSGTTLISFFQPALETYNMFDHIILLFNGLIVCQGPYANVLNPFEFMEFRCSNRKGVANFLPVVTLKED